MKKLTRLLLINWHYFQNEIIDFGDINFLTGRNSAGKSTIIDALQVVLMGETRSNAFNRAANKKSDRDLKSYLMGSLGEDIESGKNSIRAGKDFSSFIVAEFFDDFKSECFCLGAVFDSFSDGGEIRKRFFYLKSRIPESCFIENGKTMDSRRMVQFFKEKYNNRFDTKDTAEAYKKIILAKLNIHDPKFMTMLKKAISFEPITDIEKFITENVCDIEDDIDITAMQENIIYYKRQEVMAESFEKRLGKLSEICRLYSEIEKKRSLRKIQQFLIDYGTFMDYCGKLEKAKSDLISYNEHIEDFKQKSSDIKVLTDNLKKERDKLITDKEKYWSDSNGEWLEAEQKRIKNEIKKYEGTITDFILSIKKSSLKWRQKLEKCCSIFENDELFSDLQSVILLLKRTEKFYETDFEQLSVDYFAKIRELFLASKEKLNHVYSKVDSKLQSLNLKSDELENQIKSLKSGIISYPAKAQKLKEYIHDGLQKKYNKDIFVNFLADLIDVNDEEWHNAVEGYLNTQRMNIIVPPQYFMDAYYIYKDVRKAENIHEYAIVDLQKVYENSRTPKQNSLAEKVKSKDKNDKYVHAYIDFLLGNVICCYDENKLRDFRTSVTRDCMLYHNFAVKPLNSNAYNIPYIGRDSIEKQIRAKELELIETKNSIHEKMVISDAVKPVVSDEWFLTENYISSAVYSAFSDYKARNQSVSELEKIEHTLSKIDLLWIDEMDKKIREKDAELDAANKKAIETNKSIWEFEREKDDMVTKKIPELEKNTAESKKYIDMVYSESYQTETGFVRYEAELIDCKFPCKVVEKFTSPIKQTATFIEKHEKELIDKRNQYNTEERTSFSVADVSNNDEYEKSYVEIKDTELPKYRERIESAKNEAMEQFKSDFLYKLRGNIQSAYEKINDLNRALKLAQFGNDTYRFKVESNPAYREYYDMIMSDLLEYGNTGLCGFEFTEKYQTVIESLFSQIISLESGMEKTAKEVEIFSRYKTYLKFSLLSTDMNGRTDDLSKTIFTKSGGESQTPFYISVLASFAQLYMVNDSSDRGNTARIVIFDEAFNKMDSERIIQSVHLLRKFGLQAIVCSPPEKAADIAPVSDKTLLVQKLPIGKIYKSTVIEWTKEMSDSS